MFKQKLVFRADGDSKMGLGHVVRSLALLDILKHDFNCSFAIMRPSKETLAILHTSCEQVVELPDHEDSTFLNRLEGSEVVIIDGYHFSQEMRLKLRNSAFRVVAIDDECRDWDSVDMVINYGLINPKAVISKNMPGYLLLGLKYLIVRVPFMNSAKRERSISEVSSAFICMGGADPFNITLKALKACLLNMSIAQINVVVGSAYEYEEELATYCKSSDKSVSLYKNMSASELAELIAVSDIALTTSSSIALEACCVKVGLIIGMVANNQQNIHDNLLVNGCCLSVGDWRAASVEQINESINSIIEESVIRNIVDKQKSIIDGLSDQRILVEFKKMMTC
jgi:UDP-2,4-diacetamido-2,4,6-trideoxy-beta-L-altropyranose hydrolase